MDIIRANKYRIWIKLITFAVITALLCQNIAWAGCIEGVLQAGIPVNELDVLAPQSGAGEVSGSMAFLQMYNDLMDAEKRPRVLAAWEMKRKKLLDLSAIERNRFSIGGLKRRFKEDFTEQEKEAFARDLEFLQQNIFPELTEEQARTILDNTYPSGVYLTLVKEMFKKAPIQMLIIYFMIGFGFLSIIWAIRYEIIIAIIFLLPYLMFFLFQLGYVLGFFSSIYFPDAGIVIIKRNRQFSFIHEVVHYIGDRIYKDQKDKIFASAIEFIRQDDPIRHIGTFGWLDRSRIKSFNKGISFIRDMTLLKRVKADFIPVAYLKSIDIEYHDGGDMIAGMAYEISRETRNRQDACTFIRLLYKGYSVVQAELAVRIEAEYRLLKQEKSSLRERVITDPEDTRLERPPQILPDCPPGGEIDLNISV